MGRIEIGGSPAFQKSASTASEFDREGTVEGVKGVLEKLSKAQSLSSGRVCYVVGMGKQPRSAYISLQRRTGIQVVFFRSVLPRYARLLRYIVASEEGLIRIDDPENLPDVFLGLMELSMVGAYCMARTCETDFIRSVYVDHRSGHRYLDFGLKIDPGYLCYIVDADNVESSTGIVEIISYGVDVPDDLIPVV